MVTVRGRKKSIIPQMRPPTSRRMISRDRTPSSEEEEELLEPDSTASLDATNATFVHVNDRRGDEAASDMNAETDLDPDSHSTEDDTNATIVSRDVTVTEREVSPPERSFVPSKAVPPAVTVPTEAVAATTATKVTVAVEKKVSSLPTTSKVNTSTGSTDSGNSESMDTTEKIEDDGIPGMYSSVTYIEEQVNSHYPVTARPPCIVDSALVSFMFIFLFIYVSWYI